MKAPHPATRPTQRPPHPATVLQPRMPHAATVALPKLAPHAAKLAPPAAKLVMPERAPQLRPAPVPTSSRAWPIQAAKEPRPRIRDLATREKVLEYVAKYPDTAAAAIGEWNRKNPDDRIEVEAKIESKVEEKKPKKRKREAVANQVNALPAADEAPEPSPKRRRKEERREAKEAGKKEKERKKQGTLVISPDAKEHILLHTHANNDKRLHGVYLTRKWTEIQDLIREAVLAIRTNSNSVLAEEQGGSRNSRAYVVDMGRRVGTMSGYERNGEFAYYLRVELNPKNKQVHNAFPADTADLKH